MRGSVLIVHDDVGVRRWLGEFLAANDFKVLSASSGQEALAVLEEDVPALLVIGLGMPLLSGWKLVEALAHYPDLSRIPRLLVGAADAPAAIREMALAILNAPKDAPRSDDPRPAGASASRRGANA
jgi:two-component system chemotaxis response regulator CheY